MKPAAGAWPRGEFLGVPLDGLTVEQFGAWLRRAATVPRPGGGDGMLEAAAFVGYLNAHTSNLSGDDDLLGDRLRAFDVVYADGMAVVWGARRLGVTCPERVNAGDFILDLLAAFDRPIRLALVGGDEALARAAGERFLAQLPDDSTVQTHAGYLDDADSRARVVDALVAFRPDLLLLGMGSPRQEHLAAELAARAAPIGVVWCVGALFEYIAGRRHRAPRWMRRLGLEWLVRLVLEPRRLWRRYLVGNVVFVWRVLRAPRRPPPARSAARPE